MTGSDDYMRVQWEVSFFRRGALSSIEGIVTVIIDDVYDEAEVIAIAKRKIKEWTTEPDKYILLEYTIV